MTCTGPTGLPCSSWSLVREIQSSPLLVLGTYRDVEVSRRHPLAETLGSLIRERRFLRVQLPGLAEPEVEQLIQRAAVVRPPPGLSADIHQRTEGNPLFVTEIIRMLPIEGLEEDQDYLTSIPEGVKDAIGRRLNRLSEGCNQVLTTASVVGREFDFRLLSALMDDFTEAQLLGLVDEALEAHVIEEVSAGGRTLPVQPRADPRDSIRGIVCQPQGATARPDRRGVGRNIWC